MPMAGLFGTVYGMILAFQSIVSAGGNADPVLLAGIGTALVTTFWGIGGRDSSPDGIRRHSQPNPQRVGRVIAEVTKLIRPFDADLRKASAPAAKPASIIEPSGDSASERRTNAQSNASMAETDVNVDSHQTQAPTHASGVQFDLHDRCGVFADRLLALGSSSGQP